MALVLEWPLRGAALLIFSLRVVDVSMGTMRTVAVINGRTRVSVALEPAIAAARQIDPQSSMRSVGPPVGRRAQRPAAPRNRVADAPEKEVMAQQEQETGRGSAGPAPLSDKKSLNP